MDKNARKVRNQDVNPCIDESDASQKCLDASNYDKSMCSAYFQRYKNCRKYWRILDMHGAAQPHECIYNDEAGFNLGKNRRWGRNIIGQRAIVYGPPQHEGNITLCAVISLRGLLHHHAKLGPYNAQHIITFLDALHDAVVQDRPEQPRFVVVWDKISFHRAALVQNWFTNHDQFEVVYLPPYSPFLNPIEEFFSARRWRIYDHQPHARMPLLQAMEQACRDIEVRSINQSISFICRAPFLHGHATQSSLQN